MSRSITREEMKQMMQEAADSVEPDEEDFIEIKSRRGLDEQECGDLHIWLTSLPEMIWSQEDCDNAFKHLLDSRCAVLTLPKRLVNEAVYFKVKWG